VSATPRRMRSNTVLLGVTALAAAGLTGCAAEPDYAAICVDPESQNRVEDTRCDDGEDPDEYHAGSPVPGFFWFYFATSSRSVLPAVGSRYDASAGTYSGRALVSGGKSVQRGGMPSAGAKSVSSFTRSGGFGTSRGVSSS
jgi:hypothetical protein